MLDKLKEIAVLYDLYAPLLTEKQREYLVLYYEEDLSLAEIADAFTVSRNAIYDGIKKAEKMLVEYEEKLQLARKSKQRMDLYERLRQEKNEEKQQKIILQLEEIEGL